MKRNLVRALNRRRTTKWESSLKAKRRRPTVILNTLTL
jgi:hypothetical protein